MRNIILLIGIILILNQGNYAVNLPDISQNMQSKSMQNEATAEEILKKLEAKFDIHITYESEILDLIDTNNGDDALDEKTIDAAFKTLFKGVDLTYKKIRDDFFVILESKNNQKKSTFIITGSVFDENNIPLPSASVYIKETQKATITDLNGNFVLKVSLLAKTLKVSFNVFPSLK